MLRIQMKREIRQQVRFEIRRDRVPLNLSAVLLDKDGMDVDGMPLNAAANCVAERLAGPGRLR
jgi:hypothetical protein